MEFIIGGQKKNRRRAVIRMYPNEQLRRERQRRGWSRQYVAEQIGVADPKTVGRWERGVAFPSSYFLQKLCMLFGMMAQDLGLFIEEHDNTSQAADGQRVSQRTPLFSISDTPFVDPAVPPLLVETDGLVGRDSMYQQLKHYLCAGKRPTVSALSGLPGAGKTALARELVFDEDVQQQFADGILWASLGLRPDVGGLLGRWASVLGAPAAEAALQNREEELAMAIREAIGMRHMLLVIDDAWTSEEAFAFKVGGPHCAHLLTTRMPPVALNFANGGAMVVRELGEAEGMLLLAQFVPGIFAREPGAAQALVQSTGGLPLALALIGKYLQSEAYSGQPRRLRAALERLRCADYRLHLTARQAPFERSTGPSLHAPVSLQAAIETSVLQLEEAAQQVLSQLSVFPARPHSFSEEAALAVSGAPVELLDELIDAGLLESAGPGRYTLHQTIADYAGAGQDTSAAYQRMFEYCIRYAEMHETDFDALELAGSNGLASPARIVYYQKGTADFERLNA
jgi:transcriptional regulator with XRE-family HTH domain